MNAAVQQKLIVLLLMWVWLASVITLLSPCAIMLCLFSWVLHKKMMFIGYLLSWRKSPIKRARRWTLNNADDNIHGQKS